MGKKTAEEVTEGLDLSQYTIIVTGGTHGLGKETVRVLAKRGAHVFLAARNLTRATEVKEAIAKETPTARIDLLKVDLASLDSVKAAAREFLAQAVPLNVLVCNAGRAVSNVKEYSIDGVELTFATNYLGHVLLTQLLLAKMKETARESGIEGRIVNVSSDGHKICVHKEGIQFDAIVRSEGTDQKEEPAPSCLKKSQLVMKNYGQSKLAQILYTRELAKRLQEEGAKVTVNSLHPGAVTTNFSNYISPGRFKPIVNMIFQVFGVRVEVGASTQVYLAVSPEVKGVTGKYFINLKECQLKHKYALDEELQKKLWDFSMKYCSA